MYITVIYCKNMCFDVQVGLGFIVMLILFVLSYIKFVVRALTYLFGHIK